jgi:hypothetical protein
LTLRLRLRIERSPLQFKAELTHSGSEAVEIPEPDGWDSDFPQELSHSSDSQGELWVRRVGEPNPTQRYSCTDSEPTAVPTLRIEPGATHSMPLWVGCLGELEPGEYEARVRIYQPPLTSDTVRFRVPEG